MHLLVKSEGAMAPNSLDKYSVENSENKIVDLDEKQLVVDVESSDDNKSEKEFKNGEISPSPSDNKKNDKDGETQSR